MGKPPLVHVARYLAPALLNHLEDSDEIVAGTANLDEGIWRPHSIGTTRSETECVLHGLRRILAAALLSILILLAGCSAHVEVNTERFSPPALADTSSTVLAVDAPTEPPPNPITPPVNSPTISGNTFILNYRGGDTYYHSETHLHVDQSPPPRIEERIVIRTEPDRQIDERCEQMAREHRERVKRWRESPGTMGR